MEDKYESLRLKNQLCFPIYLCAKEITRKYATYLENLDLTYTQYLVMMYFWEKKESNLKELGKILLLDSSTLTPLLKKLEKKGYLTRTRSTLDERNLVLGLTEKGKQLEEEALRVPEKMRCCMNLTEEEMTTLYQLSYKLLQNVKEEMK